MRKLLVLFAVIGLVACGGKKIEVVDTGIDQVNEQVLSGRKTSYTMTYTFYANDFKDIKSTLNTALIELNGYIEEETQKNIIVQIPSEKRADFITFLEKNHFEMTNRQMKDYTDESLEIAGRLEFLIKMRDKYQNLLSGSTSVEDTISAEKELMRINNDIIRRQNREKQIEKLETNTKFKLIAK
ncbi:DUF4349 domain-containing protein [Lachnospiraceae bacterium OttesenSCG-928-E19]|nr:DUF4349 domain-containing protein [Lachnospiraceae bacterium OttesenSCG-928-E19]